MAEKKFEEIGNREFFGTLSEMVYKHPATRYELCGIDPQAPYEEVADDVEFMVKLLFLDRDLRIGAITERRGKCTVGDLLEVNELFHAIMLMAEQGLGMR